MSPGHDLAMHLRHAYLLLHRRANARLTPSGLTSDQFVLLTLLAEEDGITQTELTLRSSSDPNTVRAILVILERRGLVTRRRHESDARARCVRLTEQGREVQRNLASQIRGFQNELAQLFTPSERQRFQTYLNRVTAALTPNIPSKQPGEQQ